MLRDAAALGSGSILSRVLIAIWLVFSARTLGVAEFGRFSVLLSVLLTAQAIADAGLPTLVTRQVSTNGLVEQRQLIVSSFALQGCIATAVAVVTLVVTIAVFSAPLVAAVATAVGAAVACVTPIAKGVLRATHRFKTEGSLQTLSALALLAGTFVSVSVSPSASSLLMTYALVQILTAVAAVAIAVPRSTWRLGGVTLRTLREAFVAGLPFNIMSTASLVYLRLDVLALGWTRSSSEVGNYAAALQVYQASWILGSVLSAASLPRLSRSIPSARGAYVASRDGAFRSIAWPFVAGMLIVGVALGLLLVVTASSALPFVLGADFNDSVPLLQVLACSLPFVYGSFAFGSVLIAMHRERVTMVNALVLACLALAVFPAVAADQGSEGVTLVVLGLSMLSTVIQSAAVLLKGKRVA